MAKIHINVSSFEAGKPFDTKFALLSLNNKKMNSLQSTVDHLGKVVHLMQTVHSFLLTTLKSVVSVVEASDTNVTYSNLISQY